MPSTVTLNNGVLMRGIGLGVFRTPPEQPAEAVSTALRVGYRHVRGGPEADVITTDGFGLTTPQD